MKRLSKPFALVLCFAALTTLTSCLNSDDNNSSTALSESEQATLQLKMSGSYTGAIKFYKAKTTGSTSLNDNYQTISPATWRVSAPALKADSTITVNTEGMASAMTKAFTSTESNDNMKSLVEALASPVEETTTVKYCVPSSSSVTENNIYISANMYITAKVNYGGADRYVYFLLAPQNSYSTSGVWASGKMTIEFVLYGVYTSDSQLNPITNFKKLTPVSSSLLSMVGIIMTTETTSK